MTDGIICKECGSAPCNPNCTTVGLSECNELLSAAIRWLNEAAEEIEDWGNYASDYFKEKHDLDGTIKKFNNRVEKLKALRSR